MSNFKYLTFSIDNGIATIILNRPDVGNVFNLALAKEFNQAASLCMYEKSVRVVLLKANGRFFCAGGDLHSMAEAKGGVDSFIKELTEQCHGAYSTLMRMRAPVIGVVNGPVAGIGMSLSLVTDITIASENAYFIMAYTASGLSPDGGSSYLLPKTIGLKRAKEMMLTNRKLSAKEALEWGLVNQVVPADVLNETALSIATSLAKGATNALGSTKSLLLSADTSSLEGHMAIEAITIANNAKSNEGQIGLKAFVRKERPDFLNDQ